VVFAAEPYDNIAFKIPNIEIDMDNDKFTEEWDKDKKKYLLHLSFKPERTLRNGNNNNTNPASIPLRA